MKKVCAILLFLSISLISFGQEVAEGNIGNERNQETKIEQPVLKKAQVSAKFKAKFLKINRKKSKDIISIKAYRKSLQIKVKSVKTC